jgi:hypothetical protein
MTDKQIKKSTGRKPGPCPGAWITGPDALLHAKYRVYGQQKNQAQWRQETWQLDFETWCSMWGDKWELRGRSSESYCMTRIDRTLPWNSSNVVIVQRKYFLLTQKKGLKNG